jgi:hypothetical protein
MISSVSVSEGRSIIDWLTANPSDAPFAFPDAPTLTPISKIVSTPDADSSESHLVSNRPSGPCIYPSTFRDRLGLNLLCAASNFTFHNRSWSLPELIDAVLVAIVSRHIPSIIEAVRVLCNLATSMTPVLVRNRVPEMLHILAKHARAEVVLLALQTLVNMMNCETVKKRGKELGIVALMLELLDGEEVDEFEKEAIAAVVMNFGEIEPGEARRFAEALEQYKVKVTNE